MGRVNLEHVFIEEHTLGNRSSNFLSNFSKSFPLPYRTYYQLESIRTNRNQSEPIFDSNQNPFSHVHTNFRFESKYSLPLYVPYSLSTYYQLESIRTGTKLSATSSSLPPCAPLRPAVQDPLRNSFSSPCWRRRRQGLLEAGPLLDPGAAADGGWEAAGRRMPFS